MYVFENNPKGYGRPKPPSFSKDRRGAGVKNLIF